jgi:hypothetical protein
VPEADQVPQAAGAGHASRLVRGLVSPDAAGLAHLRQPAEGAASPAELIARRSRFVEGGLLGAGISTLKVAML